MAQPIVLTPRRACPSPLRIFAAAAPPLRTSVCSGWGPWSPALALIAALMLGACDPGALGDEELDEDDPSLNLDADPSRLPLGACHSEERPEARVFDRGPEGLAGYDGQSRCDPDAKPGVLAFSRLVLDTYPCTRSGGISRACSVGDRSEHKEGRAWDWMVNYPSTAASTLLHWLLADNAEMARRLGIMYMIWNRHIWKAYEAGQGWQPYSGVSDHTNHVHFSFSWAGALKRTSYWDGEVNRTPAGWLQAAQCDSGITGWAQDPNQPKEPVRVELHIAGEVYAVAADEWRGDLCDKLDGCRHGFERPIPPAFRDGALHHVRAFAIDRDTRRAHELNGSPRDFNCK